MTTQTRARAAREPKLEALQQQLLESVAALVTGEGWKRALTFAAQFRSRSFNNTRLIYAQRHAAYNEGRVPEPTPRTSGSSPTLGLLRLSRASASRHEHRPSARRGDVPVGSIVFSVRWCIGAHPARPGPLPAGIVRRADPDNCMADLEAPRGTPGPTDALVLMGLSASLSGLLFGALSQAPSAAIVGGRGRLNPTRLQPCAADPGGPSAPNLRQRVLTRTAAALRSRSRRSPGRSARFDQSPRHTPIPPGARWRRGRTIRTRMSAGCRAPWPLSS